jgi:DNA-binding XRE family transcriptional regulator
MPATTTSLQYQLLKLGDERYAVLPEHVLKRLMKQAGVQPLLSEPVSPEPEWEPSALNAQAISEHLVKRRERIALSQADLARQAGVRVETLNRIERGKTNPDFSTIRKLVTAIRKAESRQVR